MVMIYEHQLLHVMRYAGNLHFHRSKPEPPVGGDEA